jgi:hypothetical protein
MTIGIAELPKKPKQKTKKNFNEKTNPTPKISSLREYLLTCPNFMDVTFFETQDEAYEIGNKIKEVAMKEEGAKDIWSLKEFSVDIGWLSVRIRFKQDEKAPKPEYQDEPPQKQCRGH